MAEPPEEEPPEAGSERLGTRGVLYPARLPTFTRIAPSQEVIDLVRWFWIPEWDLAPGRTSRQHVIAFPASNLVVEGGSVDLFGPATRASHRDLTGAGWAVGALLRPAAVPAFTDDPGSLQDGSVPVDAPALRDAVTEAMGGTPGGSVAGVGLGSAADPVTQATGAPAGASTGSTVDERHGRAVAAFEGWLLERVGEPDDEARLANSLADVIDTDPSVIQVGDAAAPLGISVRTAQRLCRRYVGLPPAAMIRRRRLQEAAEAVRRDSGADLADLAAQLGYADHAHLTRDFRDVLGFTPSGYRTELRS